MIGTMPAYLGGVKMRMETSQQAEYVQGILKRLAWQYLQGTPLPSRADETTAKRSLSLDELWRLWRYVRSEGYDE
jgi:hypothetical protein